MKIPFFSKQTEKKENPIGQALFLGNNNLFQDKINKREYIEDGYMRNVIIYRAVKEITTAISNINLYVKNGDKVDYEHDSIKLLNNPNPNMGKDAFLKTIFVDFLLTGEMAIAKYPEIGEAVELWPINPIHIEVKPGRGGIPSSYVHKMNDVSKTFPVNPSNGVSQLFFHKEYNPLDYWRGLSPLKASALAGDTHNSGMMWNYSLLKNGARPSGIVQFEAEPDGEAINRLREYFKKTMQGSHNAGELPILTDGAKWLPMDNNPKDMDYINTMKEMAKYIASAFGVPLPLIDNDASTFNNMEQAKERLWTDTVIPLLNMFLSSFSRWLFDDNNLLICADLDSVPALEGVRQRRFERMLEGVSKGVLTVNEAREELGYERLGSEADMLLVDANKIPLGMSGIPNEDKAFAMQMKSMGYDDADIKAVLGDNERVPPKKAQNNAKRGLELRKEYGRGMTEVGVARAKRVASGGALSENDIQEMAKFNRHRDNYNPGERENDGGPTAGTIAWLGWGGTTGIDWAIKKSEKIQENE